MGSRQIRVVVVEDEILMARFLEVWLRRETDFIFVGHAADGESGWTLCERTRPDLVLLDIVLPKLNGIGLAKRVLEKLPETRILFMSGLMDPATVWEVIQIGGHGYVEKMQQPPMLVAAMRAVAGGGHYFSPAFQSVQAEWLSQPEAFYKVLSERELEVLRRVANGWDDQRAGASLGISAATVAVHRKHMREKLGVHNDRDLMGYAQRWGLDRNWIEPPAEGTGMGGGQISNSTPELRGSPIKPDKSPHSVP
ncbi:MAG: response regulator transcription factor [Verrucomicrobia bacterium]|nr:response regulator transcription factor [Verrucomicrobiota bacterium]